MGIKRPVEYKPAFPNDPYPADSIYEMPEGEYCTVHGHGTLIPPIVEDYLPPESIIDDEGPPEGLPGGPWAEDIGDPYAEENWEGIDWGNDPRRWD